MKGFEVVRGQVAQAGVPAAGVVPAGARVEGVDLVSTTFRVRVRAPSELPPVGELAARLRQQVPGGFSVVVSSVVGQESEAAAIAP